MRLLVTFACVLACCCQPIITEAQSSPTSLAPADALPDTPRSRRERRAVPNYDGLPPATRPEEVALIPGRVLLAPLYFIFEYLIRRPLGELVTLAERERWYDFLVRTFTFDERRAGIIPTALYDFGGLPSVGLYFFWNDLGAPGHRLRVHAAMWGLDWLNGSVYDGVVLARGLELSMRANASRRPDQVFQGFGPLTRPEDRARYRRDHVNGALEVSIAPWNRSQIMFSVGIVANDFRADGYDPMGHDPSFADALSQGSLSSLPPGFEGYIAYRQRLRATFDTRIDPLAPEHGLRFDALAEQGIDLGSPSSYRWVRYGASLAGSLEVARERVLSLHLRAQFVDSLSDIPVPFVEQIRLGESLLDMPGFFPGTLTDRSSAVATLRHRWPIWALVDATAFIATGNVFGEHLRDFELSRLRLSWGVGLQALGDSDYALRVVLAFGTRAFEDGADIEAVRFYAGGTLDF